MENEYSELSSPPVALEINPQIAVFLSEIVQWGKFLAVLGFIFTGLIALVGIFIMVSGSDLSEISGFTGGMGTGIGFFYLLMSLLYFFPSRFLYRFCMNIKTALDSNDQAALTLGFENLKSTFKFWGIICLIMIAFYAVAIIGVFIAQFLFRS